MHSLGNIFIVATPIGNLEDITLRAISILKSVEVIYAEDTRVTKKLLNHYDINNNNLYSFHANSNASRYNHIKTQLETGHNVALVTDAGTPGVSDPGYHLISFLLKSLPNLKVIPIPGPSALTAAISMAPINLSTFSFLGFVPQKKGRNTFFQNISNSKIPTIFYESKHRLLKTLKSLNETLDQKRKICVIKEITKLHENVFYDTPKQILDLFTKTPELTQGEFVIIVDKPLKTTKSKA